MEKSIPDWSVPLKVKVKFVVMIFLFLEVNPRGGLQNDASDCGLSGERRSEIVRL